MSLESAISGLSSTIGEEETNCTKSANAASAWLQSQGLRADQKRWSNEQVISKELKPAISGEGFRAVSVFLSLPDVVSECSGEVHLNPMVHAFIVLADGKHATLCQSWEETKTFECSAPITLADFMLQLSLLDLAIKNYVASPSNESHDLILTWFLKDTRPSCRSAHALSAEAYEKKLQEEPVEFFRSKLPAHRIPEFFQWVESNHNAQELFNQMARAVLAGRAVSSVLVLRSTVLCKPLR